MANRSPFGETLPLTPSSITKALTLIGPYIIRTPLLTSPTLSTLASSPSPTTSTTLAPRLCLYLKCENLQLVRAFKSRGAHHALLRLQHNLGAAALRKRGVITHSSGNHAAALAYVAKMLHVPATIVMPLISSPKKIANTRRYGAEVVWSGSTSVEREAVVQRVVKERGGEDEGPILIPPYEHRDIILGQGTVGREMEEQFAAMVVEAQNGTPKGIGCSFAAERCRANGTSHDLETSDGTARTLPQLDAVVAPLGGGGLLAGIATWFSLPPAGSEHRTLVFGAEPSFQGADDACRGLVSGTRVESVSSLTIADGLRTPVGALNWEVVSDKEKVEGVYSVSEGEIKQALKVLIEEVGVLVEPSAAVGLAVVLFNKEWRAWVEREQRRKGEEGRGWDVGVVLTGGNVGLERLAELFGKELDGGNEERKGERLETSRERELGKIGMDGKKVVENVAG